MNIDLKKAAIIAAICAALSFTFMFLFVKQNQEKMPVMITAIKAAVDIPEGTQITEDMITQTQVLQGDALGGGVIDPNAIVGKYTTTSIFKGEQILKNRLIDSSEDSTNAFSYKIPDGMRTVTISISPTSSVAGLLKVGDHVDIIANYYRDVESEDGSSETQNATKYLATNIEIAALDKTVSKSVKTDENGNAVEESFTTVTMLVSPELAKAIIYLQNNGTLVLTLRNPQETMEPDHTDFSSDDIARM